MKELYELIVLKLTDKLAEDIVVVDFQKTHSVADYFIIASARNQTHASSLIDEMEKYAFENNYPVLCIDKNGDSGWYLIDIDGIVVHIFFAGAREYYALEELWKDLIMPKSQIIKY